uniref:Uncharacterized protein n=1 Tax=Pithovirus LCPAC403 TaxID=2506596 RepID=A0A481ZBY3_9VIRU|nr:MAG: uncharacterized protein LCPAC403_04210 [Pithovirus LCPAC403]
MKSVLKLDDDDQISIIRGFNKFKNRMNKITFELYFLITSFLSFDELRLIYMVYNDEIKCLRASFEKRTDSIPWILNIIVKIPLMINENYLYKSCDVAFTSLNIGDYDLFMENESLIDITSEQLHSVKRIKERIGKEIITRNAKDCFKTIVIKGVGGKIALLSFYPRQLEIPLKIKVENGKHKASIRGDKVKIRNISFYDSHMIDMTFFSEYRMKPQKPQMTYLD